MVQEFKNSSTLVKVIIIAILLLILVALGCGCILLARTLFFTPETASTHEPTISFVTPISGDLETEQPIAFTSW